MKITWRAFLVRSSLVMGLALMMLGLLQLAVGAGAAQLLNPVRAGEVPVVSAAEPITPSLQLLRKLHPQLARQLLILSGAAASPQLPIIVVMRERPDLTSHSITAGATPLEQRQALVHELQTTAAQSQAGVRALLAGAQLAGRAREIRPLWINNSIAAQVDRATLYSLAARDDVELIKPDRYIQWIEFDPNPTSSVQLPAAIEWNIAQIHADQVWSTLNVTGTGVVVANIDTGVDWLHPALQTSYRGYNPKGITNHLDNWFDATGSGAVYPVDSGGHGTHTMGTMVGQDGIGVAPGAKWMAVRAFDSQGFAYDSWLHAAFQWILAPNGDASRAPDIVNNSWGNSIGGLEEFRPDVQALNSAGIATFFSNGNSGPNQGSVDSPASYPEAFGVGATDAFDTIAWFSSRGPSPFGPIKPDISAPGVNVRSSFPGGAYLEASGTSMAAPHLSGVAALLRSAAPGTSIAALRYALTSTAFRPTTDTYPNNIYGWGRVDAWRAVLAVAHTSILSGVVASEANAQPVLAASIQAASTQGSLAEATTDAQGRYAMYAAAGLYTMTVSAFGYVTETRTNVVLTTTSVARRDFALKPLPVGQVSGKIADVTGTQVLTALLSVQGAPVQLIASGIYSLNLPIGAHTLQVQAPLHRAVTATVMVTADSTIVQNFVLPDAPRILLLDSGRWYNGSEIGFYRQALQDSGYLYDEWPVIDLSSDVPTSATLRAYNVVVGSFPLDSPGYIGADRAVRDFLQQGGRLLLSGQDVGYYDGNYYSLDYYHNQLLADWLADDAPTRQLTGTNVFAGQVISIAGVGGAQNQVFPDVIAARDPFLAQSAFVYAPDQSGGQTVGLCRPYRAVYLSYGFEAIADRAARADVISRAFDFFAQPPTTKIYRFNHALDPLISPADSIVTGTFDLYNFDEVATTTFSVTMDSAWSAAISPTLVTLAPCTNRHFNLTVQVPAGTPLGESQPITITAVPTGIAGPPVSTTLIAKTPGSVLLVDDDRWYDVAAPYRDALTANGISFDLWRVPTSWIGFDPAFPSADRMSWSPQVIWFTGYDWYQTITISNEQTLANYLSRGGRVLISSQGYQNDLFVEDLTDFSHQTLGILDRMLDVTTTLAHGPQGSLLDGITFAELKPPYSKHINALAPQPGTDTIMVGDHGWPIALAHDMGISKTLFLAFGFEGLPPAVQPEVMNRFVGYLSWLGQSGVEFDRAVAQPRAAVTATLVFGNDGPALIHQAAFTAALPPSATLITGDALTWNGSLLPGQTLTRTWTLSLAAALQAGSILTFPVELADFDHALHFTTQARLRTTAPNLVLNLTAEPAAVRVHDVVSWTLTARNLGPFLADTFITANVPFSMTMVSGTLASSVGTATEFSGTIGWNGAIGAQEVVTVTYQAVTPLVLAKHLWYGSAIASVADEVWQAGAWVSSQPYEVYLPVLPR